MPCGTFSSRQLDNNSTVGIIILIVVRQKMFQLAYIVFDVTLEYYLIGVFSLCICRY